MKNLTQISKNKAYIIQKVQSEDEDLLGQLGQAGIVSGQQVTVLREAPIFHDPLLIQVNGSRLSIGRKEASVILVEDLS